MLQFLKLGGSLITDKDAAHTPRLEVIDRIALEIAKYTTSHPQDTLLLGHGSGSFGHVPAAKYGTRDGVLSDKDWSGFHEVWQEARELNQIVTSRLISAGLRSVSFSPAASVTPSSQQIISWNIEPIRSALGHHLLPVIYGDVAFDIALGGTILSTEDLFLYLAGKLHPSRILIAGIENGVWSDFPSNQHLLPTITPDTFADVQKALGGSQSKDVTGGMLSKVESMLELVQRNPDISIEIFSGIPVHSIYDGLCGKSQGTTIKSK